MKTPFFVKLQHLMPHHCLSRAAHWVAECRCGWFKNAFIKWFIKRYQVDMSLAENENPESFAHFNDFFTRPLKADARPIPADDNIIISPADGAISQLGKIEYGRVFQAKGHDYSLTELVGGDVNLAQEFNDGSFATIYLSPKDYHRVHMPYGGTLRSMIYVPGRLFSVNQTTTEHLPGLFARNERVVCIFDTDIGPMAVIMVGAMIVASIETTWAGLVTPPRRQLKQTDYTEAARQPIKLAKGDEMGRFKLGSTAIVLFGKDVVNWEESLNADTNVLMGSAIGQKM
ncbi:archaetidylserine decarboxylase [Spartinivicinus marinus]|uniref:archaetidylserine decarboxylase n=1 Tax=Spartinivicinus marinus TaxID=2994442 RepID=UPI002259267E|nr:archaetidylserine decarboxylase [Spartinivicinus marinus]